MTVSERERLQAALIPDRRPSARRSAQPFRPGLLRGKAGVAWTASPGLLFSLSIQQSTTKGYPMGEYSKPTLTPPKIESVAGYRTGKAPAAATFGVGAGHAEIRQATVARRAHSESISNRNGGPKTPGRDNKGVWKMIDAELEARLNDIEAQLKYLHQKFGPAEWKHIQSDRAAAEKLRGTRTPISPTQSFGEKWTTFSTSTRNWHVILTSAGFSINKSHSPNPWWIWTFESKQHLRLKESKNDA
jgi:hypothetical protein